MGFVSFFQVLILVDVFYPLYLIYHRVLNAFNFRGVVNLKLLFTVLDSVTFCDIPPCYHDGLFWHGNAAATFPLKLLCFCRPVSPLHPLIRWLIAATLYLGPDWVESVRPTLYLHYFKCGNLNFFQTGNLKPFDSFSKCTVNLRSEAWLMLIQFIKWTRDDCWVWRCGWTLPCEDYNLFEITPFPAIFTIK